MKPGDHNWRSRPPRSAAAQECNPLRVLAATRPLISWRAVKTLVLTSLCGWLLLPHAALAKNKSGAAHLEVEKGAGTEHCLDEARLSHAVEARLQRRVFRSDLPVTLDVKVAFSRGDEAWSAVLTMHDGAGAFLGHRSLETQATDCSALDDSLALVVALLVESPPLPVAESEQLPPPQESSTSAPSPPETPSAPPSSNALPTPAPERVPRIVLPADTPAPRAPWRLRLAAGGVSALEMLPGFAFGVELGLGAKAPQLPELRLFGGWYAPREQRTAAGDAGARFHAMYLGLEVCPLERALRRMTFTVCAGQSVGRMQVTGFGFDENSTSDHLTYALLARAALQFPLFSRLAVRFGLRAELPLARGAYSYGTPQGAQQGLYQPGPVAAVLDLGLVVEL